MMSSWNLHDGVTIAAEGNFPALDGVIAYIDGDTIGVRLTGESQGMGDHSGSVDGIDYFDCPLNSGVLTTTAKITKRTLSWSEEQQLRRELQPKPFTSPPPPSSIPLSGLSPAALAKMAQLQKRMDAQFGQAPKNRLPPQPQTPVASNTSLSLPTPPVETREPPTLEEEEKPNEEENKPLSRLELLRQRKEAIRLKKLALQEKVQDKKDKQQQQQQQEETTTSTDQRTQTEPETITTNAVTPQATESPKEEAVAAIQPTLASASQPASEDDLEGSKRSTRSHDSLEKLWIRELRHESPPAAARYGYDEDDETNHSEQAQDMLQQPSLEHSNHNKDEMEEDEDAMPETGSRPRMSRLQELRQRKRLLEALPASIATTANAPAPDTDDLLVVMQQQQQEPLNRSHGSTTPPPLGLPSIAMASAAAIAQGNNDDNASTSTLSTQMSEMGLDDDEQAEQQEAHAVPTESFQESVTITASAEINNTEPEESTPQEQTKSLKRRRMLGLGFLPTNRRQQKRRDTGRGKGHQ